MLLGLNSEPPCSGNTILLQMTSSVRPWDTASVPHGLIKVWRNSQNARCGMQVEKGKEKLQELMSQEDFSDVGPAPWGALFGSVMGDRSKVEDGSALPQTGMPAAVEQDLSSIFVEPCHLGV